MQWRLQFLKPEASIIVMFIFLPYVIIKTGKKSNRTNNSGSQGMGQAQSQSASGDDCDSCILPTSRNEEGSINPSSGTRGADMDQEEKKKLSGTDKRKSQESDRLPGGTVIGQTDQSRQTLTSGTPGLVGAPGVQSGFHDQIPAIPGGLSGPKEYSGGQIGIPGQIPAVAYPNGQVMAPGQGGLTESKGTTPQIFGYPSGQAQVLPGQGYTGSQAGYPGPAVYPGGPVGAPGRVQYSETAIPGQVLYSNQQGTTGGQTGYTEGQVGTPGQMLLPAVSGSHAAAPGQPRFSTGQGMPRVENYPGGQQTVIPGQKIYPGGQAEIPGQSLHPGGQADISGQTTYPAYPGGQAGVTGNAVYSGGQPSQGVTGYMGGYPGTPGFGVYPITQGAVSGLPGGQSGPHFTSASPDGRGRIPGAMYPSTNLGPGGGGSIWQGVYGGQPDITGSIPPGGSPGQTGYPPGLQIIYPGIQGGTTGKTMFPAGTMGIPGQPSYSSPSVGSSGPAEYPNFQSGVSWPTAHQGTHQGVPGQVIYPGGLAGSPGQAEYPVIQDGIPRPGGPSGVSGTPGQSVLHGALGGSSGYPSGQTGFPGRTSFSVSPPGGQIGVPGLTSGQSDYPAGQIGILNQFNPYQQTLINQGRGSETPTQFPHQTIVDQGQKSYVPGQGGSTMQQPGYTYGQIGPFGQISPGQSSFLPGQTGQVPGQTGATSGQPFTPGQTGFVPGHLGLSPSQTGYQPGLLGSVPGQAGSHSWAGFIPGQGGAIHGQPSYISSPPAGRVDQSGTIAGTTLTSGQKNYHPGSIGLLPGQAQYGPALGGSTGLMPEQTPQIPGQAISSAGQSGSSLEQASYHPGQTGFVSGQSSPVGPAGAVPIPSGYLPGHTGAIPGQVGALPGQTSYIPSPGGPELSSSNMPGQGSHINGQSGFIPGLPSGIPSQTNYIPGQIAPTTGQTGQARPAESIPGQTINLPGQSGFIPGQPGYAPGQGGSSGPVGSISGQSPGAVSYTPSQTTFLPGHVKPSGPAPDQAGIFGQGTISSGQAGPTLSSGQTGNLPGSSSRPGSSEPGVTLGYPGYIPGQPGVSAFPADRTKPGLIGGSESGGVPGTSNTGPSFYPNGAIAYPNGTIIGGPGTVIEAPNGKVDHRYENVTGDAQAETSVFVEGNNTKALASSQGKIGDEVAQAQVSGSYAGTGAFSAQAQTGDDVKRANSQITGGANGTTSLAQGTAGNGQTQSQVSVNGETGATLAETQSTGFNYGTNTQVQAGIRGGMADAQAKGQGSTSSQAQIGFSPYQNNSQSNPQTVPFRGGGAASSQTNKHSGQSETQIQGSFRFGISYTGAAQAGTGPSVNKLKPIPFNTSYVVPEASITSVPHDLLSLPSDSSASESSLDKIQTILKPNVTSIESNNLESTETPTGLFQTTIKPQILKPTVPTSGMLSKSTKTKYFGTPTKKPAVKEIDEYSDEKEDVYDEEIDDVDNDLSEEADFRLLKGASKTEEFVGKNLSRFGAPLNPLNSAQTQTQTQNVLLALNGNHNTHIIRASDNGYVKNKLHENNRNPQGTNNGAQSFGSKVTSTAGTKTLATASPGSQAQSQTVVFSPGSNDNVTVIDKSGTKKVYSRSSYVQPRYFSRYTSLGRDDNTPSSNDLRGDTYVTVTKSETGQLKEKTADSDTANKYAHTYYTKSSTCGYFTFTCSIINGSNGRTKICKPNHVINNDGAPCK